MSEEAPQEQSGEESLPEVNSIIQNALSHMDIPVNYRDSAFGWQIAEVDTDDGKKVAVGVLSVSDGNGIKFLFYGPEAMEAFAGAAVQMNMILKQKNAALNPLVVANLQQMNGLLDASGQPMFGGH